MSRPGLLKPKARPSLSKARATDEEGPRPPILIADGVSKSYRTEAGPVQALRDLSIQIERGEFVGVMGPSGCGKTTLLNCLSGLDEIDKGRVLVEDKDIHRMPDGQRSAYRAKKMGFIFQSFNLIPVFTALENTELPLLIAGVSPSRARRRAEKTLERVGLGDRKNHRPNELSGGEQQRVTIARALAGSPGIVWADEPTGNLDSETAASIMELLVDLNEGGLTLVVVTHDPAIGALAGRLIHMRDGVIEGEEAKPQTAVIDVERVMQEVLAEHLPEALPEELPLAPKPRRKTTKKTVKKTAARKKTTVKKTTAKKTAAKKTTAKKTGGSKKTTRRKPTTGK